MLKINGNCLGVKLQILPDLDFRDYLTTDTGSAGTRIFQPIMERFPDVHALAEASDDEVMKYWQGLGYYSRAVICMRLLRKL